LETDDGRDLASLSTKQVPPTAALLHQEHFSPLELLPICLFNTSFSLIKFANCVFKVSNSFLNFNLDFLESNLLRSLSKRNKRSKCQEMFMIIL
jgi:hypothetical protein